MCHHNFKRRGGAHEEAIMTRTPNKEKVEYDPPYRLRVRCVDVPLVLGSKRFENVCLRDVRVES